MRSVRGLVGMPVVCEGKRFGRVLRADLAADLRRMDGVWVGAGLRGARYIPAERLQMLGKVAVHADCPGQRRRMQPAALPMRAVSTDGRRLGAVTGADVDELSFQVQALELSAGVWDDLATGRSRVTRYTVDADRGEVVIEPDNNDMEAYGDEERNDEGTFDGHADRRFGRDDLRRAELADRAQVEPDGETNGQLDQRQGRGDGEENVTDGA